MSYSVGIQPREAFSAGGRSLQLKRNAKPLGFGRDDTVVCLYQSAIADGGLEDYAVKIIQLDYEDRYDRLMTKYERLRTLHHDNVIRMVELIRFEQPAPPEIFLVMEYCDGGRLTNAMEKGLCLALVKDYSRQTLQGLQYLHEQHIVHTDIKPDNILLHKKDLTGCCLQVKLADLDDAVCREKDKPTAASDFPGSRGTREYLSPEMLAKDRDDTIAVGRKTDLWSFGRLLHKLVYGCARIPLAHYSVNPSHHSTQTVVRRTACEQPIGKPVKGHQALRKELQDILDSCLQADPEKRLPADKLLASDFCADAYRLEKLLNLWKKPVFTERNDVAYDFKRSIDGLLPVKCSKNGERLVFAFAKPGCFEADEDLDDFVQIDLPLVVKLLDAGSPVSVELEAGEILLPPIWRSVAIMGDAVAYLTLNRVSCPTIPHVFLPNLVALGFKECSSLTFSATSLAGYPRLAILQLVRCDVKILEKNFLLPLDQLEHFAFEPQCIASDHCSCASPGSPEQLKYAWLRSYLLSREHLSTRQSLVCQKSVQLFSLNGSPVLLTLAAVDVDAVLHDLSCSGCTCETLRSGDTLVEQLQNMRIEPPAAEKRLSTTNFPEATQMGRRKISLHGQAYEAIRFLGTGTFGTVYEYATTASNHASPESLAFKFVRPDVAEHDIEGVERKYDKLLFITHENIVVIKHVFTICESKFAERHLVVAMEYCDGGDLSRLLRQGVCNLLVKHYSIQILQGLRYLHASGVVHADIKPENLLLTGLHRTGCYVTLKLADVDDVVYMHSEFTRMSDMEGVRGTPRYFSPEMRHKMVSDDILVGRKSDVWSFGCVLHELLFGRTPASHGDPVSRLARSGSTGLFQCCSARNGDREYHQQVNTELKHLLTGCLTEAPEERLSAEDILSLLYFSNCLDLRSLLDSRSTVSYVLRLDPVYMFKVTPRLPGTTCRLYCCKHTFEDTLTMWHVFLDGHEVVSFDPAEAVEYDPKLTPYLAKDSPWAIKLLGEERPVVLNVFTDEPELQDLTRFAVLADVITVLNIFKAPMPKLPLTFLPNLTVMSLACCSDVIISKDSLSRYPRLVVFEVVHCLINSLEENFLTNLSNLQHFTFLPQYTGNKRCREATESSSKSGRYEWLRTFLAATPGLTSRKENLVICTYEGRDVRYHNLPEVDVGNAVHTLECESCWDRAYRQGDAQLLWPMAHESKQSYLTLAETAKAIVSNHRKQAGNHTRGTI